MGKIAERLALKSDPLFNFAKSIAKDAIAYVHADTEDAFFQLSDTAETALNAIPDTDIQKLLSMTMSILEPRHDAQEVMDEVCHTVDTLCSTIELNEDVAGHLVSLPIVITSDSVAWKLSLAEGSQQALAEIFKEFDLVEEDAGLMFLPRLLAPMEAEGLSYGDTRKLLSRMAAGNLVEALAVVEDSNRKIGLELTYKVSPAAVGKPLISTGILVGYLTTKDAEPYPLSAMLDAEIIAAESISETDETTAQGLSDQALKEIREVLALAAPKMAAFFTASALTILRQPEDWFSGVSYARQMERQTSFYQWVRMQAAEFADGTSEFLSARVDTNSLLEEGFVTVELLLKSDAKPVATFNWYSTTRETIYDNMAALQEALASTGIMTLPTLSQDSLQTTGTEDEDSEGDDDFPGFLPPNTPVLLH
jgi:hypothetical protein